MTADFLVRGTAFAVQESWHLLQDAVLLFQNQRYPSSLALSTYCLEQLGRSQLYWKNAKRAANGEVLTLGMMSRDLIDHFPKLAKADIPVHVSAASASNLPLSVEEEKDLAGKLAKARQTLEKRAPQKALEDRSSALHVDPLQHFRSWNRPSEVVGREDADYYLGAACDRYDSILCEFLRDTSDLGNLIGSWISNLELKPSPWDVWDWAEKPADPVC